MYDQDGVLHVVLRLLTDLCRVACQYEAYAQTISMDAMAQHYALWHGGARDHCARRREVLLGEGQWHMVWNH
jgi:hypothetical protein